MGELILLLEIVIDHEVFIIPPTCFVLDLVPSGLFSRGERTRIHWFTRGWPPPHSIVVSLVLFFPEGNTF